MTLPYGRSISIGARRMRGLGSSAFAPLAYPGAELLLWSGVGLYQDTAGATPATANSDPVGRWDDQSTYGRNVTQGTAINRPLLKTNQVDSRSALLFDGINDVLRGATAADFKFMHDGTASWTAYVVFRVPTLKPNAEGSLFGTNGGSSSKHGVSFWYDDATASSRDECLVGFITKGTASNGVAVAQKCIASGAWSLGIMQFEPGGAGDDIRLYTDSTTAVGSTESINTPYSSSNPSYVMDVGGFGNAAVGAASFYLGDLLIYRGAHSAATMQQFIDYLTARWKLGRPTALIASGGLDYNAFPGTVKLSNGNQVLCWREGSDHATTDGFLNRKISTDGGRTWGSTAVMYDDPTYDSRDSHAPCELANGNIIAHAVRYNSTPFYQSIILQSSDGGVTWGSPVAVTVPSGYDWFYAWGRMHQLAGGTILLSGYAQSTASGKTDSLLLQSTDSGATWTLRGTIADGSGVVGPAESGYNETDILNTSGSNWLAMVRRDDAGTDRIYKSASTDDGVTWGAVTQVFTEGVSPGLCDLGSGKILVMVGDRVSRSGIRAHISTDAGATWSSGCMIYRNETGSDLGYPSPVMGADGYVTWAGYDEDVGAVYGNGVMGGRFYKDLIGA